MYLQHPFPEDPRVLNYCRFSTDEQRQQSIADQDDYCRGFLDENGCNPRTIELLSDEGLSGELQSRPGIDKAREGIRKHRWDLIVVEDSSRLYRGIQWCLPLVGLAVNQGIRVICINDGVDTANDDWEQKLTDAQLHHGKDNYYTRFRIKRAHDGLWKMGAAIGPLRPGYRRYRKNPDNPKSPKFDEIDPQWFQVILRAFRMVATLRPLEAVARYLTQSGLPKTSNGQTSKWTDRNVISLIRCAKYRGVEFYRQEISKKDYEIGGYNPVTNPDPTKVLKREMPHLRMVQDWLWHKANKAIDDRATPGMRPTGREHPLHGIPRDSRSLLSNIFVCGICGSKMHAEGRNEGGYRCSAARHGECWNKATCLRDFAHGAIVSAVSEAILAAAPDSAEILIGYIESLIMDQGQFREEQRNLAKSRSELQKKQQRLINAIQMADSPPEFLNQVLEQLQTEDRTLQLEEQRLQAQLSESRNVPNRQQIEELFESAIRTVQLSDDAARPLLRQLLDGPIRAVPYQPFGNSNVVLKAEFSLQLVQLMPDEVRLMLPDTAEFTIQYEVLRQSHSIHLSKLSKPQEHAFAALEFYDSRPEKRPTLKEIAAHLKLSERAAHLALQLGKQLRTAGLNDAFVRLTECPPNPARWRFKDAS
ncbi:MAG: recombinase family protein [Bdellovibrionales bacterium]|nr:recombinase family protein [Bdellovibrionales bacterium]